MIFHVDSNENVKFSLHLSLISRVLFFMKKKNFNLLEFLNIFSKLIKNQNNIVINKTLLDKVEKKSLCEY